jgi:hypothetical protein
MNQIDRIPSMGIVPANMSEAMRFAEMMANSKLIPKQFQKNASDCLMVVQQSIRWDMDPFAVVQECAVIQDRLMYSGKLVAAVVNTRGRLTERLVYSYNGSGNDRAITVSGRLPGEMTSREVTVRYADARTAAKVWQMQPDQQLAYHGARVWARRHVPELMLGVYSPEEFDADMPEPRANVHVNRPEDFVDVPPPDHPDRIPNGAPDIKPLPKKDARADFGAIQTEMYAIDNIEKLQEWGKQVADRVATFPLDWQEILRGKFVAHLNALRTQATAIDGDWLRELDGAYSGCEDASTMFEVDLRFSPQFEKQSAEQRAEAEKIRAQHFERIEANK